MAASSKILIVDYDPEWPRHFASLRAKIWPSVQDVALRIEHVGSTAVPGMAAKDVIDLDVVVADRADLPEVTRRLTSLSYEFQGDLGVSDRYAFRTASAPVAHHLYVCVEGTLGLRNHLLLRDHLRETPADASAYSALKKRMAIVHGGQIGRYTRAKTEFILRILGQHGVDAGSLAEIRKANQAI